MEASRPPTVVMLLVWIGAVVLRPFGRQLLYRMSRTNQEPWRFAGFRVGAAGPFDRIVDRELWRPVALVDGGDGWARALVGPVTETRLIA